MNVLITGGAGFIGRRLVERLRAESSVSSITVFDNLSPQIHGADAAQPVREDAKVKFVLGDVRDKDSLQRALAGSDAVVHLAAETGTGQSMYEATRYESVNIGGTAHLVDYIVNDKSSKIRKIVVASSRAIYGEGQYYCREHGTVYPAVRDNDDLVAGNFEPRCPKCGVHAQVSKTAEDCPASPSSFYGLTKRVQEEMVLMFCRAMGIDGIALRYQNVYGPGQSLINPYTGILAVFSNLARANKGISIFEDGLESRDFVYIDDVVAATAAALLSTTAPSGAYNVGSGVATPVMEVATLITRYFSADVPLQVTGAFRIGDIRHNIADTSKAEQALGFQSRWKFADGLKAFLDWAVSEGSAPVGGASFDTSIQELRERGLYHGKD